MSQSPSGKRPRTESAPASRHDQDEPLRYLNGWGGYLSTEALPKALPDLGNTPQRCPYGLYAEQVNGTSFTKAKHANQRIWFYRCLPSANHKAFRKLDSSRYLMCQATDESTIEQIRWMPLPMPTAKKNFIEGMVAYCGAGDPSMKAGIKIFLYACNANMVDCSFTSSDGDFLIVPEHGTLTVTTECGKMELPSGFIGVIPRGIRFSVDVPATGARGYIAEVFDSHFELPPLGIIGANGNANLRDFEVPVAAFERRTCPWTCYQLFNNELFAYDQDHSPFDVVAWHGNYHPYRYDLAKFCAINTVTYDHLDPSIFCVLTAQTGEFGVACCDFVIFPPRWMVGEKTFRPPYYHKNVMTEFMGNIRGTYEAKEKGFLPGGASLHSHMAAHGPEAEVFEKASTVALAPTPPKHDSLAFMFESYYTFKLSKFANSNLKDPEYMNCWAGLKCNFDAARRDQ